MQRYRLNAKITFIGRNHAIWQGTWITTRFRHTEIHPIFSKTQQFWSHSYWKTVSSEIEPEPASWTSVGLTFSNETIFSVWARNLSLRLRQLLEPGPWYHGCNSFSSHKISSPSTPSHWNVLSPLQLRNLLFLKVPVLLKCHLKFLNAIYWHYHDYEVK